MDEAISSVYTIMLTRPFNMDKIVVYPSVESADKVTWSIEASDIADSISYQISFCMDNNINKITIISENRYFGHRSADVQKTKYCQIYRTFE